MPLAARARLPRRSAAGRRTCRRRCEHRADSASRASTTQLIDDMTQLGHPPARPRAAARRATAGCWSSSAARRRTRPTRRRARCMATLEHGRTAAAGDEALRRPERRGSTSGRCARRGSARPPSSRASPTPTRAGRTRPCRPSGSATTCATCGKLADALRLRERALRPLRPGLRARPLELRPRRRSRASRSSAPSSRTRRDLVVALRRLALGRARRRPGARRAAAEDVRRRAGRGVPRVQGDLGSRTEDEPGQGRRPVPVDENLRLGADYHPPRPQTHFALPDDDGELRARDRRAASASASAAARDGGVDVPELHGHARGEALDARPRAPALRDAERRGARRRLAATTRCRRRSTSASRARAARTTARSTSTWRRTRRSSSSHHYEARLRPRHAYAFGLIDRAARLASRVPAARERRHADAGSRGCQARRRDRRRSGAVPKFAPRRCSGGSRARRDAEPAAAGA